MARKKKKKKRSSHPAIPERPQLKARADKLWSLAVKNDWNHTCAVCGKRDALNSHHMVPRMFFNTRFDLLNGICLCYRCHTKCAKYSPHQNSAGFDDWLKDNHLHLWHWVHDNKHPPPVTTSENFYLDMVMYLREYVEPTDFDRILGVKFAGYIRELEAQLDAAE